MAEHGRWWLYNDTSSYHDAQISERGRWPLFLLAFRDFTANQAQNHTPPGWVATAGQETLLGNWAPIPVAFLNSKGTQQQRALAQMGPTDQTTQQSAALQAALAASMRAAQMGR